MWWPLLLALSLQDQPAFRSDVALVHVEADVRRGGRVVADLTKDDIRVLDNGRLQPIVYFAHEEQPIDVVLLFDTRAEMRSATQRVVEAAGTVLGDFRSGDRIGALAFGGTVSCKPELIQDFTADFGAATSAISLRVLQREFRPRTNGCSIQRGLDAAARLFLAQPPANRRRAVVVLDDDRGSPVRPDVVHATLQDLWQADAVVLGIVVRGVATYISIGPPYRGLRYAADHTGGDALETADPAAALRESIQRLRSRYSLYYAPPPDRPGEEHKIRVQLAPPAARRHPGATIRARSGYKAR
jgi:VWFA-related protein